MFSSELAQIYHQLVIPLTVAQLGLLIFLIWYNRRLILRPLKSLKSRDILLLLLISLFFIFLCYLFGFNFKSFIPSDQEWESLWQAKILTQGENILFHFRYGQVYPILLGIGFSIFGITPLVASILNLILAIISIWLVFYTALLISSRAKVNLLIAFIFALSPLFFAYSALAMGHPTILMVTLLAIAASGLLFFRYRNFGLFLLVLVLISLASQIKPEYFILILPLILFFITQKIYQSINVKKIILALLLFIVLSLPFFLKNISLKESYRGGWCGCPSMTCLDGEKKSYDLPIIRQIDPLLKFFTNDRMSFNFLIYKLPDFMKFWTARSFLLVSIFSLLGLWFGRRKHLLNFTWLISLAGALSFIYLIDCATLDTRYLIPTYGLIILIAGNGLYLLYHRLSLHKNGKIITRALAALLIISGLFWLVKDYYLIASKTRFYEYSMKSIPIIDIYSEIKSVPSTIDSADSIIYVIHPNEFLIMKILGLQTDSLYSFAEEEILYRLNQGETNLLHLPLADTTNNYFLQTGRCDILVSTRSLCGEVKNFYELEAVLSNDSYTLYKIIKRL